MKRILVTGGTGLLGSHLVRLLHRKAKLHVLRGDLSQPPVYASLPQELDAVVHLAQSRRFRDFPGGAGHVLRVNTLAAVELAEHAVRVGATHLIYASTGAVYAPSAEPLEEGAPIATSESMSFYAASKFAAERLLAPFAQHLNVIILRPFFIYGPGQDRSMLIPRLVDSTREGRAIELSGKSGIRINPVHAEDAARGVAASLELEGSHTINLAGPSIFSLHEIAHLIGQRIGREPVFAHKVDSRALHLIGNTTRMERLLLTPTISLADRLHEIV